MPESALAFNNRRSLIMRKWLLMVCLLMQAGVLGFMVYSHESIIKQGTSVTLKTAPIDPRDPFRGDYVRLRFAINNLNNAPTRWQPASYQPRKGDIVYAVLSEHPSGVHELSHFTNTLIKTARTAQTIMLRGRVTVNDHRSVRQQQVKFGIEQLFVEQGTGLDIEKRQGVRGGMQNAMHVTVAVSDKGKAVVTGYSWSALAAELTTSETFALRTSPASAISQTTETDAASLWLRIKNVSDAPVTLNNPGNNCGFTIEPALRFQALYTAADTSCETITQVAPLTLEPEQSISLGIDLSQPRWFVKPVNESSDTGIDVRTVTTPRQRFRIVYRSTAHPIATLTDNEPESIRFWAGDLLSQSFNPIGNVD